MDRNREADTYEVQPFETIEIINQDTNDVQPEEKNDGYASNPETDTKSDQQTQTTETVEANLPDKWIIDGVGEVTADDIKEWKLGNMRLSDYTRKTQELAAEKRKVKDALELYEHLKSNPDIVEALENGDTSVIRDNPILQKLKPKDEKMTQAELELASLKLDTQIKDLKAKYPDFDEMKVLEEADKRGIADLEFVYKAISATDIESVRAQIEKEVREKLTKEIQQNGLETSTFVKTEQPSTLANYGLSPEEQAIADNMGVSYKDYARGKMVANN